MSNYLKGTVDVISSDLLYIYILCLGVWVSVCLFVQKNQNGGTNRAQIFRGTDPREGLWMIEVSKIRLKKIRSP